MKNKKGFTLVEIVIVIALLGVLLLLVVPNLIERFAKAKKNMFYNDVLTLYSNASSTYISRLSNDKNTRAYFCKDRCGNGYNNLIDVDVPDDITYYVSVNYKGAVDSIYVESPDFKYEYNNPQGIEKSDLTKELIEAIDSEGGGAR